MAVTWNLLSASCSWISMDLQPNAAPVGGAAATAPGATSQGVKPFGREARRGLAGFLQRSSPPESPTAKGKGLETSLEQLPLRFNRLRLVVGPELSAVYPFVLNFGVSGEVEVNGAADPVLIRPSGVINFEEFCVALSRLGIQPRDWASVFRERKDNMNKIFYVLIHLLKFHLMPFLEIVAINLLLHQHNS